MTDWYVVLMRNVALFSNISLQLASVDFDSDECLKEYGIKVEHRMTDLYGRVLTPPKLLYGGHVQRASALPERGVWDMRNKTFHTGVTVTSWALCVFASMQHVREDMLRWVLISE